MAYNCIDLIDKAISIALKRKAIYEKIGEEKCDIPSIKIVSKVLTSEADMTVNYYEKLKKELGEAEIEDIDIGVYDKISFLINEFNKKIYVGEVCGARDFLKFCINLEKDIYSLLVDVQGRFVNSENDVHTITYKMLSEIINNKAKHIMELEKIL